jgi:hypothetical protein
MTSLTPDDARVRLVLVARLSSQGDLLVRGGVLKTNSSSSLSSSAREADDRGNSRDRQRPNG